MLAGFIVGAPYEGAHQIDRTVRFAESLFDSGLDGAQFSVYTPLPGTRAFYDALREGRLLTYDWSKFDVLTPVMRSKVRPFWLLTKDRVSNYAFYLRKWLHARGSETSPWKKPLLEHAESFYLENLPRYLVMVLLLPWELLTFPFRVRRSPAISERVRQELLSLDGFAPFEPHDEAPREAEHTLLAPPASLSPVEATDGGWDDERMP